MIALDTNVLVRCLTCDDAVQVPVAQSLLKHAGGVYVAKTVLLELEWVLRAAYHQPRESIHMAMLRLLGLPNLTAECSAQVASALRNYAQGMDFADALHLAAAQPDEGFFTFDVKFASLGQTQGVRLANPSTAI